MVCLQWFCLQFAISILVTFVISKLIQSFCSFFRIRLDEDHKSDDPKSVQDAEYMRYATLIEEYSHLNTKDILIFRGNKDSSKTEIIRYPRDFLLDLRDSELSKRKPEQLGRAWVRIGVSNEGACVSFIEHFHRFNLSFFFVLNDFPFQMII